ncbi:TetR/AcrR family transcriptional regulator [Nocardioides daejeonensis]|uniref:TetR/AcrR family transcriptional regulator n=1 Tax=Nocardioides daejeonensis TaxID=1046556 RepID=UPI000D747ADB|nr:TetR-like C-terminal domain-containing protein [Nocardioides daejeonensis]
MSTSARSGYHHGDLRAAALAAAMRMLEAGESFSLRAVAREVGVSAPALYRHFTDRDALESALATEGLRDLLADLTADQPTPATAADLGELAVAYVAFALRRPALFRVMFTNACDEGNEQRVEAADQIHQLLQAAMQLVFPAGDPSALADAGWAFAHGMANLYMDGKLAAASNKEVAQHVRSAFAAILAIRDS